MITKFIVSVKCDGGMITRADNDFQNDFINAIAYQSRTSEQFV